LSRGRLAHPPQVLSDAFKRLVAKSGLPRIRLHDLRHTHATLLLKAGVPIKVVSERLGHSTPVFTMATYQHVLPGMQAEAARTFAALLERPASSVSWRSPNVPTVLPGGTRS
jgi:integrase